MAIDAPTHHYECRTCRAPWSLGRWTWGCEECGGAALTAPCGFCMGTCGAVSHRAVMDSNDSGRAHIFGTCLQPADPAATAERWGEVMKGVREIGPRALPLRCELIDWSNDRAWQDAPRGPPALQVLRDGLQERGHSPLSRVLAGALFDSPGPLPELPRLTLERYWESAGSVVLLEPLDVPPRHSRPMATRLFRVHRVIADGRSWLSGEPPGELPCAGGDELRLGQRYLALVIPVNMVPGMLIDSSLEAGGRELELIDLHRRLVANGPSSSR